MGIIKRGLITAAITVAAGIAYIGALTATEEISARYSEPIKDHSQLARMIQEERAKIDPNNNWIIDGELSDKAGGRCDKTGKGRYSVKLGGMDASRGTLKHELYHILDDHLEGYYDMPAPLQVIDYLFWCEPQAAIYQATGLKL